MEEKKKKEEKEIAKRKEFLDRFALQIAEHQKKRELAQQKPASTPSDQRNQEHASPNKAKPSVEEKKNSKNKSAISVS